MTAYLRPTSTVNPPGLLTLTQFIQTVFVGITGLPGTLVRPKWQPEPPKQPDIMTNWMALGITRSKPDANAYLEVASNTSITSQRHEALEVSCSIYGPGAFETYGLLRDGFQIPQNRYALDSANMAFVEVSEAQHLPDLINERIINRVEASVFFRRKVQRVYAVPTILSASGTIYTVAGDEPFLLPWSVTQ